MSNQVTVIGLGRMGRAAVERYDAEGWDVTTWTRGGRTGPVTGAVAAGGAVVLFLFDGRATLEVLDAAAPSLRDRLVVNTSTTSPDEAEAAARVVREAGGRYVHAPVLGSVPAVRGGTLVTFAGGSSEDLAEAEVVLAPLVREVVRLDGPARAASYKLVANSSLGGAMAALADSLAVADGLGITRADALDVLARGRLAGAVEMARGRLLGHDAGPAHFTISALAKDLRLASTASGFAPSSLARTEAALAAGADVDADITAVVR